VIGEALQHRKQRLVDQVGWLGRLQAAWPEPATPPQGISSFLEQAFEKHSAEARRKLVDTPLDLERIERMPDVISREFRERMPRSLIETFGSISRKNVSRWPPLLQRTVRITVPRTMLIDAPVAGDPLALESAIADFFTSSLSDELVGQLRKLHSVGRRRVGAPADRLLAAMTPSAVRRYAMLLIPSSWRLRTGLAEHGISIDDPDNAGGRIEIRGIRAQEWSVLPADSAYLIEGASAFRLRQYRVAGKDVTVRLEDVEPDDSAEPRLALIGETAWNLRLVHKGVKRVALGEPQG
jgi:hypothetical protein